MKNQRRNEIKVGLTVLVGVLILLFGFSVFKNWTIGKAEYMIHIEFPTSAGLQPGDQVSVNGVRVGRVTSVKLKNGGVLVDAMIESGVLVFRDAVPVIQMLELMGGKKIDIQQGADGDPADVGVLLRGKVDPDIAGALGALGDVQGNITDIGLQADSLLRNLNSIVGDQHFIASVKETMVNFHRLSEDLRGYVARNEGNIDKLTANLVSLTSRTDAMLSELQPRLGAGLDLTERTLGGVDTLIIDIRGMLSEIRHGRGMLNTVLFDTSLARRMDAMVSKLDSISNIIINGKFTTRISLF